MKRKLQLTLEGDAALAFQRARAAFVQNQLGGQEEASGRGDSQFAAWLLHRASDAYAVAPAHVAVRYWQFELRLATPEEDAAFNVLHALRHAPPETAA